MRRKIARGALVAASGGTLFLDEIGDAPMQVQLSLLRALESQSVKAVGSERERAVDLRIVAATSRRLFEMMREGSFREDLFYRLSGHEVLLPALRQRRVDIPDLASELLAGFGHCGRLSARARTQILAGDYPGNARQLRHSMERAAANCSSGEVLQPEHLSEGSAGPPASRTQPRSSLSTEILECYQEEAQRWLKSELLLVPSSLTRRAVRTYERILLLCLLSERSVHSLPPLIRRRVSRLFARGWSESEGGAPLKALASQLDLTEEQSLELASGFIG